MVPEYDRSGLVYAEHLTRYRAAEPFVKGKVVLDIASGSGYGTNLLSQGAKRVIGVDVDTAAVEYAKENFGAKNIEFKHGDATNIPLEDNAVDVVVTFETIEHVKDFKAFLREIDRVLKPDGVLLMSTPNDLEFAEGNHFHVHEFQYDELIGAIRPHFKVIDSYFQGTWKYVAIGGKELVGTAGEFSLPTTNYSPLEPAKYLYFYLVCSRIEIKQKLEAIGAMGEHYSDRDVIGAWKAANGNVDRIQRELNEHIKALDLEVGRLTHELGSLMASRTFRLAARLNRYKSKFTRKVE